MKSRICQVSFIVAIYSALAAFDAISAQASANLLVNGSFESGLSPWMFLVQNGAAASQTQDCTTATDGRCSEKINVATSTPNLLWSVQLRQGNIPLTAGRTMTVSFSAKASNTNNNIEVGIQQAQSPWKWYCLHSFQLTSQWATYTFTITPPASDPAAKINFNLAGSTGTIWIDNVVAADGTGTGTLSPPAGYTTSQLIFDDTFQQPTLDSTKWIPQIADGWGIWRKTVPAPYSAIDSGSFQTNYYDPYPQQGTNTTGPHVVTGNGLRLIATPSSKFPGYTWASGVVCTHGLFYFHGGYVQFRAKMPDSRSGMWAGLWFLEGGPEMDLQESGYYYGSANVNNVLASHWQGPGGWQTIQDTGVDLSADYHIYGLEYRPGQSMKVYLDGTLKATWTQNIPSGAYEILIDLEVADSRAQYWHTVAGPNTPSPIEFDVSEVQVYKLP